MLGASYIDMLERGYILDQAERSFLICTYINTHFHQRPEGINEKVNFALWAMANPHHQNRYGEILAGLQELELVEIREVFAANGLKSLITITDKGLNSIDGRVLVH